MTLTVEVSQNKKTSQMSWLVFLCTASILILAPLIRGGNRQVALMVLLTLGLVLAAALVAHASYQWLIAEKPGFTGIPKLSTAPLSHESRIITSGRFWWALVIFIASSPVWVSLIQLIPIRSDTWGQLAGRELYLGALTSAALSAPDNLPISLVPSATWTALWASIPVVAVFGAALLLGQRDVERLLQLLFFAALIQSILGLLQLAQGPKSPFYFESAVGGIIGSFNNRNHLADFLAMLIPPWFYFLMSFSKNQGRIRKSEKRQRFALTPLWLLGGFGMLIMVLSTRSRGGLIAIASVLLLSVIIYLLSHGKKFNSIQKLAIVAAFSVFSVSALLSVDTGSLGQRWEGQQIKTDAEVRNAYTRATLEGARTFWPWGSGMGTFEAVFPRFQPLQTPGYVPHAHNDYAQMLMELGAFAVLILAASTMLCGIQVLNLWRAIRRDRKMTPDIALRIFSGLGLLALIIHSWVEFNMHIPALAITSAFLAGIFLKPLPRREGV